MPLDVTCLDQRFSFVVPVFKPTQSRSLCYSVAFHSRSSGSARYLLLANSWLEQAHHGENNDEEQEELQTQDLPWSQSTRCCRGSQVGSGAGFVSGPTVFPVVAAADLR
mmetsp:Transcript_1238/g.3008  ORF Transcript_1238/g.3008 Transcript_1238/m.3008 type:complete len:109 (+) Transcript_1238:2469-2795(+)